MAKSFLGVGTSFPLQLDAKTGEVARAAYEESVRQAILIILGTARGERLMRPDFGCEIHDLVFASMSAATIGRAKKAVNDALLHHESRIDVTDIDVQTGGDGNVLFIDIQYEVRATNNVFNLVYPFYLQESVPA